MLSDKSYYMAKTFALCLSFFGLGLCYAVPGPTLLDLMHFLKTDLSSMATIYVGRSSGYLLGSIISGVLFEKCNRTLLLFLSLFLTAISISSIPWFNMVWLFSSAMAIVGISMGFLDTGGNVLCLDMWGKDSGPYLQSLHFSAGLGAFLAPLLAKPFLENQFESVSPNNIISTNNSTNKFLGDSNRYMYNVSNQANYTVIYWPVLLLQQTIKNSSAQNITSTADSAHNLRDRSCEDGITIFATSIGFTNMQLLYLIIGLIVFVFSLIFLGFLCFNRKEPVSKQQENVDPEKITSKKDFITLIGLMAWFFFVYVGMDVAYGQMLLTYSVKSDLHVSKSIGSLITSAFWGSYAAMRLVAIFCSSVFGPLNILLFDFFLYTVGTIILYVFGNKYETMLWAGSVLLGAGSGSVFPTAILWLERYISISNKVAVFFVVGAAMGEMICPFAVGYFMEITPMALIYAVNVGNALCIVTFALMWFIASNQGEKHVLTNDLDLKTRND